MAALEGMDIFASDFINQEIVNVQMSPIQNFFIDTTIFVTGGTGFLGKLLIEKLLRSCRGVKLICVLVRPKKGKTADERLNDLLDPVFFQTLRLARSNYRELIRIIPGDCTLPNLGISETDLTFLINNVEIIFNTAGIYNLHEHIKLATQTNVQATRSLVLIAQKMRRLKSFIHVSSVYTNCNHPDVHEKFYPAPLAPQKLLNLVDILDNDTLEGLTPQLLGDWPNTFTYTKMIAETILKEEGRGLPMGIIRPSTVLSPAEEPLAGWTKNVYGLQGLLYAIGLGLMQTAHCNPRMICDIVPADLFIRATIAFSWEIGITRGDAPNLEKFDHTLTSDKPIKNCDIPIFNYVSCNKNPITWENFYEYGVDEVARVPSIKAFWISDFSVNSNFIIHKIYQVLFHLIPGMFVDMVLYLLGRQPFFLETYRKIHRFESEISWYAIRQWNFQDLHMDTLLNELNPKDKNVFNFNLADLVWENYFGTCVRGIRIFLFRDNIATVPEGKLKRKRLIFTRIVLRLILVALIGYLIWGFL